MHVLARRQQAILQLTQRVLPGADHDVVHRQYLWLTGFTDANVQAFIVDLQVLDAIEHLHLLVLQTGAVNPAGGLAQAVADLGFLALQQEYITGRCMGCSLDPGHTAARLEVCVDAPLFPELVAIQTGGLALVNEEFRDVEADAAGTDHCYALAYRLALQKHVQVAQNLGVLDARNRRSPWRDPRRQDDLVETALNQLRHIHASVQAHLDVGGLQFASEITQGLEELFLARHTFGHVELTADLAGRIEQRHLMAALGCHGGGGKPRRTGTDHSDLLDLPDRHVVEFGFVAGTRVDQATGQLAAEGVVQARLVATDARVDFISAAFSSLVDEVRVGEERPRHGHHVGIAFGQDLLGHFRGIDAVGSDQRNVHRTAQLGGDFTECRTRHLGGDGRNSRFVPADTGVDDRRTRLLDGLGQQHDFVPGTAALDQIEHRQTENDDEVRANGLTHPTDNFHRQAHAVFVAAAPAVGAVVGVGREELVNEITFRTHDFDAVVLGLLRQGRAGDEIADLFLDAFLVQLFRLERVDRRLNGAWRDLLRAIRVTAGVENLHADLAARLVHRTGNDTVLERFFLGRQLGRARVDATLIVRADTAGDHQADPTPGTFGKVRRHALETTWFFFKAGVHRTHQGAVAQRGKTQVQRGQQVRVMSGGHR